MSGHSGRPSDRYLRRIFADSNSREKEAKSDQSSRKTRVQREAQEQIRSELSTIERIGQWFAICISLAIVAFGLGASGLLIKDFLKLVSFAFIILFCSTTIGGSLGFLFAIPRLLQRSQQATEVVGVKTDSQASINTKQPGANYLLSNSNLEEISDWLTKIIVGVGLINLSSIAGEVSRYNSWLAKSFDAKDIATPSFLVILSLAGLVLGLLFFYLQTRTRITLLLLATERARDESFSFEWSAESQQTRFEFAVGPGTDGAVVSHRKRGRIAPAVPLPIDPDVLRAKPSISDDAERWAAWAAANARLENMGEAVSAWEMAIQKEPHKGIYHKQLGDVYQAVERYQDAVGAYELARRKGDKTGDLLKSQLIAALYTDTSEAEKIAIRNADELYADPYMRKDRWILLWRVCAYAQRFGALPQGDKERARVRDIVKQGLEEIVARFPDAKSSFRVFLRQLLEPGFEGGDPNENDLEIFQHDSEITELIRGTSQQRDKSSDNADRKPD